MPTTEESFQKLSISTSDGDKDQYLFNFDRLKKLSSWSDISALLKARKLLARPLKSNDFEFGYLELLSELTLVGNVSKEDFEKRYEQMKKINTVEEHYMIVVIEDTTTKKVVGTSTLFLEYKFIHKCAMRGRLEDVAVLNSHRGRQIGELVVRLVVELSREAFKCYKLTLDCKDELVKFYAKNNFTYGAKMLSVRFRK